MDRTGSRLRSRVRWGGLFAGPILALACYLLIDDTQIVASSGGDVVAFGHAGRATLGLLVWMGVWWLTEAIDVSATALLPLAVLPLVTAEGSADATRAITDAAAPYANRYIVLFMGGFILALSMERWGLHRRIALNTLRFVGARPRRIIAGFMLVTAAMSMWVSNTATTVMMLPIALSVAGLTGSTQDDDTDGRAGFLICLMLGIAYAASVGGIGTLIGTPPNTLLASFVEEQYGLEISFARWLAVGLPLVIVFVPIIWLMLTRVLYPVGNEPIAGGREIIARECAGLGRPNRGEVATFIVFVLTAACWITRPLITKIQVGGMQPLAGLSDPVIAVIAAMALFVIPVDVRRRQFVMDWKTTARLPWGILILFGGGLSLAAAVKRHGVADFLGMQAESLAWLPGPVIVVCVVAGIIFLTELTSNTATTAALLPVLAGMAPTLGVDPLLLIVPAAIAASCAFMMPVATPPNAIVFGSGFVTIPQMCRAGLLLNLIGIVLVTLLAYAIIVPVFGSLGGSAL